MVTATTAVSVAITRSRSPDRTIMVAVTTTSTRAMPRAGSTTTRPISGAAQASAMNSARTRGPPEAGAGLAEDHRDDQDQRDLAELVRLDLEAARQ